jgi:hypothetical protein
MRGVWPLRRVYLLLLAAGALAVAVGFRSHAGASRATEPTVSAPLVKEPVAHDTSPPLRTLIAPTGVASFPDLEETEAVPSRRAAARTRSGPGSASTLYGPLSASPFTLLESFPGISVSELGYVTDCSKPNQCWAADASGAVGPNHYMQSVNFAYSIYDKQGTRLLGPTSTAAFWSGFSAAACGGGWTDVVVLYDHQANRWFVSRFARDPATNYWYQCFAISQTPDPTGSYYRYAYLISQTEFNDYPKFGIWPDAYYMTAERDKTFSGKGQFVAAFERDKMLAGDPNPQAVLFTIDGDPNRVCNPNDASSCDHRAGMLPADWDGRTAPPAGAPNYMVRPISSALGWSGPDTLELWQFHVDWGSPGASTLTLTDALSPTPYQPACGFDYTWSGLDQNCIPQPGTSTRLDPLASGFLMYRLAYRNFGNHEALVLNQTVDVGDQAPNVHAGVRWYELRRTGGSWSVYQQGDYAPDGDHRWIGSIAMDRAGDIALGYNVSGASRYPSIAYAGRAAGDPLGTLSDETTLQAGGGSQTGYIFWGDYSQLTLDPTDDCTFWYVNGYQPSTRNDMSWATRISAFRSPSCPKATTSLSYTSATTGDYHDQATLSSTLTNTFDGLPVQGATLAFGLDGQSCTATTDVSGQASCFITPNEAAGSYPLTVHYAGTAQLEVADFAGTFVVTHEETTLVYTGPTLLAQNMSNTFTALLREDGVVPIAGRTVTVQVGSGLSAQTCSGTTNGSGVAMCTINPLTVTQGPQPIKASFAGDAFYQPSSASATGLVFAYLAKGSFVLGDLTVAAATPTTTVTWWSSSWSALNALSGGSAPPAFKGYAGVTSSTPPVCGGTWTTGGGASPPPPAPSAIPAYMATAVASSATKSGTTIAGNIVKIVIVQTDAGYSPASGHDGTGKIVATLCG